MKYIENEKIKVIFDKDPNSFEKQYNKLMDSLNGHAAEINIDTSKPDGFCAVVRYSGKEIFSTEDDSLTINGNVITCQCCPYLQISTDNRRKDFPCKYAHYGSSRLDSRVCDKFKKDLLDALMERKVVFHEEDQ